MASGDPDVQYTHAGHCNSVGTRNQDHRHIINSRHTSTVQHVQGQFSTFGAEAKASPDMVQGAFYDTGNHLMAYGTGVSTESKLTPIDTEARTRFTVWDHSGTSDYESDFASDDGILTMRKHQSIDQLMRAGATVPMRFNHVPIEHCNQMTLNLVFTPHAMFLSEILAAAEQDEHGALVIKMPSSQFHSQFGELATLAPKTYHAAVHDIQLLSYQTKGMPVALHADLQSAIPSGDQSEAGYCSWIAHNTVSSSSGSLQPLLLLADTTDAVCNTVCYTGDDQLLCMPTWCRWSQVDIKKALGKINVVNGYAQILYATKNQTQATDPIQFEVARSWPELRAATQDLIEQGKISMRSVDEMVTLIGDSAEIQQVLVKVPMDVLVKSMRKRSEITNRERHMISFDDVRLVLTPASPTGWTTVKKFLEQRKNSGPAFADPLVSLTVQLRVRFALAMCAVNGAGNSE